MPENGELRHLTHEEQDVLFQAFTTALQISVLPVLARHDAKPDECPACTQWQLVRALATALIFFSKRFMREDETLQEFMVDLVTGAEASETSEGSVH